MQNATLNAANRNRNGKANKANRLRDRDDIADDDADDVDGWMQIFVGTLTCSGNFPSKGNVAFWGKIYP